jgi:hypothetical protein
MEVKETRDFISEQVKPESAPASYIELRDIPYPQAMAEAIPFNCRSLEVNRFKRFSGGQ